MMEFNQNLEIAMFVSCVLSSCIHFPVLRPEQEAEAGANDLLAASEDDALPPAETFPINKFKQLLKFLVACTRLYNPLCRSVGPSVGPSVTLCFFSSFYVI